MQIFSDTLHSPLSYEHLLTLNAQYEKFVALDWEILLIASTDNRQNQRIAQDLQLKMPLLSNASCDVFQQYQVGRGFGAPLPAQFLLDRDGKLMYRHLYSALEPNAPVERLHQLCAQMGLSNA